MFIHHNELIKQLWPELMKKHPDELKYAQDVYGSYVSRYKTPNTDALITYQERSEMWLTGTYNILTGAGQAYVMQQPTCCGMTIGAGFGQLFPKTIIDLILQGSYDATYTIVQFNLTPRHSTGNRFAYEYLQKLGIANEFKFNSRRTHHDIHAVLMEARPFSK